MHLRNVGNIAHTQEHLNIDGEPLCAPKPHALNLVIGLPQYSESNSMPRLLSLLFEPL
jgi:hypothetical protein